MKKYSGFDWMELAVGILLVLLGIFIFVKPDVALTATMFAYGVTAVVMGVVDIILYIRVERYTGFGPVLALISGILSVMSGIMLVVYPKTGVLVLTVLFPIWFIAHCVSRLAHLNRIRFVSGRGMYYFTLVVNITGMILGLMMLMSPVFTLTTIRYFASAYLILLGIDSVTVALSRTGTRL